jgi:hypothetical protein
MKKQNYPMISNGLVDVIDYSKLIQMQSQQPIITISKKNTFNEQKYNSSQQKRILKRTTNK